MDLSKQRTWEWKWINKSMSLIDLKAWYKLNFGSEVHKSQLVLQKFEGWCLQNIHSYYLTDPFNSSSTFYKVLATKPFGKLLFHNHLEASTNNVFKKFLLTIFLEAFINYPCTNVCQSCLLKGYINHPFKSFHKSYLLKVFINYPSYKFSSTKSCKNF
jgi:hypothetical protein